MKKSILLSLLSASLLLTACGSNSDSELATPQASNTQLSQNSVLRGSSTLADSTLCLDKNENNRCDTDEPQTLTQKDGAYTLELEETPIEGTHILSTGGYNLVVNEENTEGMKLLTSYHEESEVTNISTLTTLVAQARAQNLSYEDAVDTVASRYNLESELVMQNPMQTKKSEETQVQFLTTRAMEEYFLHVEAKSNNTNAPQRSGGIDLGFISYDEADNALEYFDIFADNVKRAFLLSLAVTENFFHSLLELVGFIDHVEYPDNNYSIDDLDVASLHPLLKQAYNDEVQNITNLEVEDFKLTLLDRATSRVAYNQLQTIYHTSSSADTLNYLSSLVASIGDEEATKNLLIMTKSVSEAELKERGLLYKNIPSTLQTNIASLTKAEASSQLTIFFQEEPAGLFSTAAAKSIFTIGDKENTNTLLKIIQSSYKGEITLAGNIEFIMVYIQSDAATNNLITLYSDINSNEEFKKQLRFTLANVENPLATNAIFDIAQEIEDPALFDEIEQLFTDMKFFSNVAPAIIQSRLADSETVFKSQELRSRIEAVFADAQLAL